MTSPAVFKISHSKRNEVTSLTLQSHSNFHVFISSMHVHEL